MINTQKINIAIKMLLAGVFSLIVAKLLSIDNYAATPAISILSIQLTRKDFITIAIKRYISGLLVILLSALLFYLFGNSLIIFIIILLILLGLLWLFNASEGIVLSVVLVSHFLTLEKVTVNFLWQEIMILSVAIIVAFIINMFYPNNSRDKIISNLRKVDLITINYLKDLSSYLQDQVEFSNQKYLESFNKLLLESELINKNLILENDQRYISYLTMREVQINILNDIYVIIPRIKENHQYVSKIIDILNELSNNISFDNHASELLIELNELKDFFIISELPKSRGEFETRAILLQILYNIERFLIIKVDFHNKYLEFHEGEF